MEYTVFNQHQTAMATTYFLGVLHELLVSNVGILQCLSQVHTLAKNTFLIFQRHKGSSSWVGVAGRPCILPAAMIILA